MLFHLTPLDAWLDHPDRPFQLWSRRFEAGTVGLGVNALDRRAHGHYAVFLRSEEGVPGVSGLDPGGWRVDLTVSVVRSGFRLASGDPAPAFAPRPLGADSDDILAELGYAAADIAALRREGAA